ncbi:MAG: hypothetical protein ACYTG2_05520 [Planctomycetota bacterium]|jgi:hypothetical protein
MRAGQDSKAAGLVVAGAVAALALVLAGCRGAPSAAVPTPFGTVRADSEAEAREVADMLLFLRPRLHALLPDTLDRPTEVWLDAALRGAGMGGEPGVAALTNVSAGRIQLRGDETGIALDFLLAHELVHALMGSSWDRLPAVMKEGLCDAVAARLVPRSAALARSLRMFAARFAFGDQALDVAVSEPGFGGRWGTRIEIASPGIERRSPLEALALRGRGVRLHSETQDEDVLYGYGLLLVERTIARMGLDGLHAICLQAASDGLDTVPVPWLLWAAELDGDPATWERALAESIGPAELEELTAHLADALAEALVGNLRYRYPDFDGPAFLDIASPTLGLRGSDLEVELSALPRLQAAVLALWEERPVHPMRPGEARWHSDRGGLHMGAFRRPTAEEPAATVQWLRLGPGTEPEMDHLLALPATDGGPDGAELEALVRLGVDASGPYLASTLPGGFDAFRVTVHGVVVADLGWQLNTRVTTNASGWSTITVRLDPGLRLAEVVAYDVDPNVLLVQRAVGGPGGEFRLPLGIPRGP